MAATRGAWYIGLAYTLWGFFPLYWKQVSGISPVQLTCHRIVWSSIFLLVYIARAKEGSPLAAAIRQPRVIGLYAAAAMTIAFNWMIYVLAVDIGEIVQTSLGYFISPLLSVLLGVVVFRERLRPLQWISVMLAAAGVLYITIALGAVPSIGLLLAGSFAGYGLLKKFAPLSAVHGLTLETGILLVPAAAYLIAVEVAGRGALLHSGPLRDALMFGAGPVTTVPLLLFAAGVKRISLTLVGMLQYISPTLQLLLATLVYHEPFTQVQLTGFSLVWAALALFALDGYLSRRWPQLGVTDIT
jgi:chloramphenicol-sensitive protein RarD